MYTIIMTTKGLWDVTAECLSGVDRTIGEKFNLSYVDANVADPDYDRIRKLGLSNLSELHYESLDCFIAPGWNRAIEMAETDSLCILNNDYVFYKPGWLQLLDQRLNAQDKVGIVGSYALSMFGWGFSDGILVTKKRTLMEVVEKGKVIDEFFKYSCTNVDLCIRLIKAGFEATCVFGIEWGEDPYARHLEQQTELASRPAETLIERRKPERKYLLDKHGRGDTLETYLEL